MHWWLEIKITARWFTMIAPTTRNQEEINWEDIFDTLVVAIHCQCNCVCMHVCKCNVLFFSRIISAMTVTAGAHHYQCKLTYTRVWKMNWKKMMIVCQPLLSEAWLLLLLFPLDSSPLQLLLPLHGKRCSPCFRLTWMSWQGPISLI